METSALPPTPTREPKAAKILHKGKVIASPEKASAPHPRPTNILSTMLYKEDAVMAMIDGMAYLRRSLPVGSVANSRVL